MLTGRDGPLPYPCINLNSGPYGTLNTTTGAFTAPQYRSSTVNGSATLSSFVVQVPVAANGTRRMGTMPFRVRNMGTYARAGTVAAWPSEARPRARRSRSSGWRLPHPRRPAMDTSEAQFWTLSSQTLKGVDSAKTAFPSSLWAFAYCPNGSSGAGYTPDVNWICLLNGHVQPEPAV